jgi:hypothetical protein
MPTVQGTNNFDHAIDAAYYTDGFFSSAGSPDAVTSPVYDGQAKSLRIVTDGNNIGARHNITGTPARGWAGFAFRTAGLPTTSGVFVCSFGTASGVVPALSLGTTGLYATIGGATGAEFAISANTWYWVECIADVSGTTRRMHFRVEGTDGASAESTDAATTISWHQMISFAGDESGNTSYRGYWQWGSATSATDWLGEPSFQSGPALHVVRSNLRW